MQKIMDRGSYEKLSIRDSARSLKKYGSTSSKYVTRNETYIKHYVSQSDTLQGIALKYNVTIEQIRRANRLWASDSLFLKEFLLIPSQDGSSSIGSSSEVVSPSEVVTSSQVTPSLSSSSFDNENISDFLDKIDASIAITKEGVKKTQTNSEFASNLGYDDNRRKPAVSRMKQIVNNNSASEMCNPAHAVVVQQGKKVRTSIKHHEKQQDELFEL